MTTQANCLRCNGTGEYRGTRRDGTTYTGPCFACQGGGPRFVRHGARRYGFPATNTNPVAVAAVAVASPAVTTPRQQAALDAFATSEPAAYGWLTANAQTSDFAASLLNGIARYGNLTPRQLACVMRNVGQPAVVAAPVAAIAPAAPPSDSAIGFIDPLPQPAVEPAVVAAPSVNLDRVRTAMESARASGLRKVRLTFGNVTLKLSGSSFRAGAGHILCYHNGSYTGYVDMTNVFHARFNASVDSATLDAFRAVGVDPRAAAATHGHETGNCACCRRLLTDPPSVMAGIGPVCIRRFGWSF